MPVEDRGRDHQHFLEIMGRGIMVGIGPKPVQKVQPAAEKIHESDQEAVKNMPLQQK